MQMPKAIMTPFGVNVFGSATISIEPDFAVLSFSVSQVKEQAGEAFQAVRDAAQQVQTYLSKANLSEAGSSRISLIEEHARNKTNYRTRVAFRVMLSDLSRTEEILTGIIEAGVNNIQAIEFQTKRLKEIRDEARRQAVQAARQKAEIYCMAAGVELGEVIHIEDLNPDQLQGFQGRMTGASGSENAAQAFDPGNITVAASVTVAYQIKGH